MDPARLRQMPRTDRVLAHPLLAEVHARLGAGVTKALVRAALEEARDEARGTGPLASEEDVARRVSAKAKAWLARRTRRVINATGVVLHTNLGRAPLCEAALAALARAGAGYVSLEVDLE